MSEKPWLVRARAPDPSLSSAEMHRKRLLEVTAQAGQHEERLAMEAEEQMSKDTPGTEKTSKKGSGHFKNIHPYPEGVASKWSNPVEQCINPDWYGWYLDEGECYEMPRTGENVNKACKAMGLYNLDSRYKEEVPFYEQMVYHGTITGSCSTERCER